MTDPQGPDTHISRDAWLALSVSTLVVFLLYLDWFFQPIVNLANVYNLLQAAVAALVKIFGLLDVPAEVVERPDAHDLATPVGGEVTLAGVTFGYNDDTMVLRDVDLEIPGGQVEGFGQSQPGSVERCDQGPVTDARWCGT